MVEEALAGRGDGTATRKVGSAAITTLGNNLLLSLTHTGERPQPKKSAHCLQETCGLGIRRQRRLEVGWVRAGQLEEPGDSEGFAAVAADDSEHG
jgi:hypothetical protein